MKPSRAVFVLVLVLVLLIPVQSLVAGGKKEVEEAVPAKKVTEMPPPSQWERKTLGVLFPSALLNEGYAAMFQGIRDWAKASNFEDPDMVHGEYDMNKMIAAGESLIAKGYDALIFWIIDTAAFVPLVQKANRAGIPCAVIAAAVEGGCNVVSNTSGADEKGGGLLGEECVRLLKEKYGEPKGKALEFQGIMAMTDAQLRSKGFHDAVEKYPGIEIISRQCDWDPAKANSAALDILTAQPDIDVLYSHTMSMDAGIVGAMKDLGMLHKKGEEGHKIFLTFHNAPSTKQMLKDGIIDAIGDWQMTHIHGLAVAFLRMAIEGYDMGFKDGDEITADWMREKGFTFTDDGWAPATVTMVDSGPFVISNGKLFTTENCDDPNWWSNRDFTDIMSKYKK